MRWPSHKDHARKALAKLAGPHLPATLKQLEQAIERLRPSGARPSPEPDEMPLVRQLGCGSRLGPLAISDFGLRRAGWNLDIELDKEFHGGFSSDRVPRASLHQTPSGRDVGHAGRSVPACSATM